jgi:predicted DNA-binding transcriptional regulator AlpA
MFAEESVAPGTGVADNEVNRTPAVLFLDDVAGILRVSRSTIERRRRDGTFPIPELPSLDRRPRWSRSEVERYVESNGRVRPARGRPPRGDR